MVQKDIEEDKNTNCALLEEYGIMRLTIISSERSREFGKVREENEITRNKVCARYMVKL